ncbi:MAG: cyclic nucleotide-binding domain-containing protein [Planctomycetaceae bacterium]|nr:cyclic nucleotide-binding domain-containing protein [Planctomycetaceae bacterium]
MTSQDLSSCLCGKVPLFAGLSPDQCRQVLKIADECEFHGGEVIVHQGRELQLLWILLEGEVEVVKTFDGKGLDGTSGLVLATLGQYANFGEMSFFHKAPHSANVRAKTAVRLLRIERERFDVELKGHSQAAYQIAANTVSSLAERMRRMDSWVADLLHKQPRKVDEFNQLRESLFDKFAV